MGLAALGGETPQPGPGQDWNAPRISRRSCLKPSARQLSIGEKNQSSHRGQGYAKPRAGRAPRAPTPLPPGLGQAWMRILHLLEVACLMATT